MVDREQPKCVICNKHTSGRAYDKNQTLQPCCHEHQPEFERREWQRYAKENRAKGIIK